MYSGSKRLLLMSEYKECILLTLVGFRLNFDWLSGWSRSDVVDAIMLRCRGRNYG